MGSGSSCGSGSGSGSGSGADIGSLRFAEMYASASSDVQVASARSQPSGESGGGVTMRTRSAPSLMSLAASLAIASRPGWSASGQRMTRRPISGDQSALLIALQPDGQVVMSWPGKRRDAASAVFSPSTTITGSAGRERRSSRLSSGLGAGGALKRH